MQGLWLEKVVTRFDDGSRIGPVSLSVEKGKMLALLGSSGSGKTTTLRVIAGLAPLVSGQLQFDGKDLSSVPAQARKVGMVFQNFGLFPHMTVEKNISFGLRMKKQSPQVIDTKVTKMLAAMHLEGLETRFTHQLSGGQKQRVALARTLIMDPDILLLDEPLSNLDANLRKETASFIRKAQQELGITTVFVTHDQEEALLLADEVAIMSNGEILQSAPPFDISERPKTAEVAYFMGAENLISGHVLSDNILDLKVGKFRIEQENLRNRKTLTQFMIRPENIDIRGRSERPANTELNEVPGTVEEARYLGGYMSYSVRVDNVSFAVKNSARNRYEMGEEIVLTLDAGAIWPLEAS